MNAPKNVLIVDDEPNVRLMLRTALESAGYSVIEAADGLAALSHLRRTGCDLILLDLRMPVVDGLWALYRLRERGDTTPVVVLTAHGSIPDTVTAMTLGAINVLTKPMTPDELRAAVSAAFRCTDERWGPSAMRSLR
jgi:DNA-binding response OmpR family regulator